ncbi:CPBP family intramembrane glutamic endopeptidase [Saccharothrix algeriensis]|uniref:CPBP family intramembrane metalloprotease n=1 Tax=Saccharothrix algeriensis TaxID=173560 RepID=A0A8T8HU17_9PSEU|nr:membrane protease YdiL (CAAX protease family) [Saccharothrix algeriensis]QTR01907.1 CPBP family intramembrane metalloprotease [Saccharothrix algeriensis]
MQPPDDPPTGLIAGVRAVGREPSPRRAGQRWGFGAFLLVEAVFVLTAVFITAIARTSGADIGSSVAFILVGSMVPTVLAAAVAVAITRVRGNGPLVDLRLEWNWADVKVGLKLGLLGLGLTYLAALVWSRVVGDQNATSAIGELVDGVGLPLAAAIAMFLYVCFVGPICEELIYRGLLWGAIERQGWSQWAAFVLTTLIFAASHLEPLRTSLLIVIALPIGIARLITRRLTASVVAHVVNNFLPGLTLLLVSVGVMPT